MSNSRQSEIVRYENTANDLLKLNATRYCDLGPGEGEIAIRLKDAGKDVVCLEGPWDFEKRTEWARKKNINCYLGEFFDTDFEKAIPEKIDCFSLIHCIAHFRFAPHILFEQVYRKLEPKGYFYLSTVNGGAFDKVLKLFRGGALTEEVTKTAGIDKSFYEYHNTTNKHMIWDNWMHVKEYRAHELVKIFESEKFKVVDVRHRNNFKHWKTQLACKIWPHLGEEIIVVGQKV